MPGHRFGRLALLALLAALQIGAAKCSRTPPVARNSSKSAGAKAVPDPQADSADQVMYGVRAVLTHQSVTKGMLRAEQGYVFDDGTRIELRRVTVTLVNPAGLTDAVLTAREGTYDVRRERVDTRGKVLVVGSGGRQLETERLAFDLARNQLVGDSAYVLTDSLPKRQTKGVGFAFSPKLAKPPAVDSAAGSAAKSAPKAKPAAVPKPAATKSP